MPSETKPLRLRKPTPKTIDHLELGAPTPSKWKHAVKVDLRKLEAYRAAYEEKLLDISVSVCGRWRATARYGGPWQGSLPGLAVWGTLHLDGGRTVLEPLGRRDNPPDQRTAPDLP